MSEHQKKSTSARPSSSPWQRNLVTAVLRGAELILVLWLAVLVSGFVLRLVDRMVIPENSNVLAARGSFLVVAAAVAAAAAAMLGVVGKSIAWRVPAWLTGLIAPAVVGTAQLAVLLKGTPYYLFGLGGDQSFRVPYLTRFVDETTRADVFYSDALSFYPPMWFWVGGRYASATGLQGWEAYKPFSLITMSAAAALAFVLWRWLVGAPIAVLLAVATAAVGNELNAYEPYSWLTVSLIPPLVAWSAHSVIRLSGKSTTRPWFIELGSTLVSAVLIGGVLGLFSFTYTLLAAIGCLTVAAAVAIVCLIYSRSLRSVLLPLAWLAITGLATLMVSLLFWGQYLRAVAGGVPHSPSVATKYLPVESTLVRLPFVEASAFGVAALIGLVAVGVACGRHWRFARTDAGSTCERSGAAVEAALLAQLGVIVVGVGWFVASLGLAFEDTSLLPFRTIPLTMLAFVVSGILALGRILDRRRSVSPELTAGVPLAPAAGLLAAFILLGMVQSVPHENAEYAQVARDAPREPKELLFALDQATLQVDRPRPIVLSVNTGVFAYRDLFSFQAPVEAYATPFAQYEERNSEIRRFAESNSTDELIQALDSSPFDPPEVFVLRRGPHGLEYTITKNQMPSQPDNEYSLVVFNPEAFADTNRFHHYFDGELDIFARQ